MNRHGRCAYDGHLGTKCRERGSVTPSTGPRPCDHTEAATPEYMADSKRDELEKDPHRREKKWI